MTGDRTHYHGDGCTPPHPAATLGLDGCSNMTDAAAETPVESREIECPGRGANRPRAGRQHGGAVDMAKRTCSVEGCDKPHRCKGYCAKHYQQHRLASAPPCSVSGCGRPAHARGFCGHHHRAWKAGRDLRVAPTVLERLVARTWFIPDCCWQWTGRLKEDGYGVFRVHYQLVSTHRWAYEHFVGPIPPGLTIDHLCRNRACWNPEHLEVVDNRTNILRGTSPAARNAKKTHCPQGHPYTDGNIIITDSGARRCRTCVRAEKQRWYARKQEAKKHA